MQPPPENLITELEAAVRSGSSEKRISTLRQVTDLFLSESNQLNDEQIQVFDEVLVHLISRIESRALAELSERLAPVDRAPIELIKRLARNDEIIVAGPVLSGSRRLSNEDLTEIARTKSQSHLLAISDRDELADAVTDVLIERGGREVVHKLAANAGARFSAAGYGTLVKKTEGDDALAEAVGLRVDIPQHLQRELVARASDAVRSKLMSVASPEIREEISRVLTDVTAAVSNETAGLRGLTAAEALVRSLHAQERLGEAEILDFARHGKQDEMTAALALLCAVPLKVISGVMAGMRNDTLLIPCKAIDLKWPTVEAILRHRRADHAISDQVIELARGDFNRLSVATAQRTLRFMQIRATAGGH